MTRNGAAAESAAVVVVCLGLGCGAWGANGPGFWRITTVDSSGNVGALSSLATLPTGFPAVAYTDVVQSLKYAWADSSGWHIQPVAGSISGAPSLAILPSGEPAIVYAGSGGINYAQRGANGWQSTALTIAGSVGGGNPSLAVLPSGQPAFSYADGGLGSFNPANLRYAWFDGQTWHAELIASFQDAQFTGITSTALAMLPSGAPAVVSTRAFHPGWGGKAAYSTGPGTWQTQLVDAVGAPTTSSIYSGSLRILPSGRPAFSYAVDQGGTSLLRYAEFDGVTWQIAQVADNVSGLSASLAVLPSGEPAVALPHLLDLSFARRASGQWHLQRVGPRPTDPASCSLTILGNGQPAISFQGGAALQYAVGFFLGDLNCDGVIDFNDINPFVIALSNPAAYATQFPACSLLLADCNQDGVVNFSDINAFVALLAQ